MNHHGQVRRRQSEPTGTCLVHVSNDSGTESPPCATVGQVAAVVPKRRPVCTPYQELAHIPHPNKALLSEDDAVEALDAGPLGGARRLDPVRNLEAA